jgi:predicted aconitase with swiveling domain
VTHGGHVARSFHVERAFGRLVEGLALVVPTHFSPRYDIDFATGIFSRPGHPLEGQSLAGRVFFSPRVQGGVAGGWVFYELASRGMGPLAVVFGATNPVMVQGLVFADIPVVAGLEPAAFTTIRSGDLVRVDPEKRRVELLVPSADQKGG